MFRLKFYKSLFIHIVDFKPFAKRARVKVNIYKPNTLSVYPKP